MAAAPKQKPASLQFDSGAGVGLILAQVEQATYGPREGLNPPPALR
jgi:hypothetical protein